MTVKRQHLVWRKYLSSWTDTPNSSDGRTFVYDKASKQIRLNSIQDVAVENYAYDISRRSQVDEAIFKEYLKAWFNEVGLVIDENSYYFTDGSKEKDFLEREFISKIENSGSRYLNMMKKGQFPFSDENELLDIYQLLKSYLISRLSTGKSMLSDSEVDAIYRRGMELISKKDERLSFFEFFANQMLRTRRGRQAILGATESVNRKFQRADFFPM